MLLAGNPSRPQTVILLTPLLFWLSKVRMKEKKLFGLKKMVGSLLAFILVAGDILPTVTGLASVATVLH